MMTRSCKFSATLNNTFAEFHREIGNLHLCLYIFKLCTVCTVYQVLITVKNAELKNERELLPWDKNAISFA